MDNLKEIREKLELTQTNVAIKVGVSLTTYRMWEIGVAKPKPIHEEKLKEVLKIKQGEE